VKKTLSGKKGRDAASVSILQKEEEGASPPEAKVVNGDACGVAPSSQGGWQA